MNVKTKAAVIADEFTLLSVASIWDVCSLNRLNAIDQLKAFWPDLLFIESTWNGADGSWSNENRITSQLPLIQSLTEFCNQNNIPTVFWNKEDPVHFVDFSIRAKLTALFDIVFTTEVDCIARYKALLAHERVYFLPFFANTQTFFPKDLKRQSGYCFAGSWYEKYYERNNDFLHLYGLIKNSGASVSIFDRNHQKNIEGRTFPAEFQPSIVGNLPYTEIDKAYSGYETGISLNIVKNGQTMFARRAVELLASGTAVVSNYTRAMRVLFGELVDTVSLYDDKIHHTSWDTSDRSTFIKNNLDEHYFQHRVAQKIALLQGKGGIPKKGGTKGSCRLRLVEQMSEHFNYQDAICYSRSPVSNLLKSGHFEVKTPALKVSTTNDKVTISSTLSEAEHSYINLTSHFHVSEFAEFEEFVYLTDDERTELDIWQYNESGACVQRDLFCTSQPCKLKIQPTAISIRIGFRVTGPGTRSIEVLSKGRLRRIPHYIIPITRSYLHVTCSEEELIANVNAIKSQHSGNYEIFVDTGEDDTFDYTSIGQTNIIIGGERVHSAIKEGRKLAAQLGYDFHTAPLTIENQNS